MKYNVIAAALACSLLPLIAEAAPKASPANKTPAPTQYRAQCGMIYSAAEAKKDHYVCPMDGQKMTAIKSSPHATRRPQPRKG